MAFFNTKQVKTIPQPIPPTPPYVPPVPPTPPTPAEGDLPHIPRPTFTGTTSVTFYKTVSDNNTVDKELSDGVTFNIDIKDAINIITPILLIDSNIDLNFYNYAYIEGTERYYYIDSVDLLNGSLFKLNLSVDILMSFRDGIRGMTGILVKTDDARYVNNDLDDGSFVNQRGAWISTKVLKSKEGGFLDKPVNILITCG